jgi:hypothetical protein
MLPVKGSINKPPLAENTPPAVPVESGYIIASAANKDLPIINSELKALRQ